MHSLLHAMLAAALIAPLFAHADDLQAIRQQFRYGMTMVAPCQQLIRSVSAAANCVRKAEFPSSNTSVPQATLDGANYQMLFYEQQAGGGIVYGTLVRGKVDNTFAGDPKAYCGFYDVDCAPVLKAIADWNSLLKRKS